MSFFAELPLRDFADHIMRHMLENAANLREVVAELCPQLVDRLDFDRAKYEPRDFLMEDWRERQCDLFVRVPFRTGQGEGWLLILILLEHQSSPDARMPLRTLVTSTAYWEREWKRWEDGHRRGQPLVLTPVLPLVFYTGSTEWNVGLRLVDLFPAVPELHVFAPGWAPLLWNLSEQDPAMLLSSASAWIRTLTVVRLEEAELAEFETAFREVCRSLDVLQHSERLRALDLLRFVVSWITRRRPRDEVPQLRQALRESLTSETVREEIEDMANKLGPTFEDVGRTDGELRKARSYLLLLLGRLGEVPENLRARIQACRDQDQLDAWFQRATQISTLEEFHLD